MVVELVAGLCRLSLAFQAACNGSPNVRRGNSGQQVYAGHVCWHDTACDDPAALVYGRIQLVCMATSCLNRTGAFGSRVAEGETTCS